MPELKTGAKEQMGVITRIFEKLKDKARDTGSVLLVDALFQDPTRLTLGGENKNLLAQMVKYMDTSKKEAASLEKYRQKLTK